MPESSTPPGATPSPESSGQPIETGAPAIGNTEITKIGDNDADKALKNLLGSLGDGPESTLNNFADSKTSTTSQNADLQDDWRKKMGTVQLEDDTDISTTEPNKTDTKFKDANDYRNKFNSVQEDAAAEAQAVVPNKTFTNAPRNKEELKKGDSGFYPQKEGFFPKPQENLNTDIDNNQTTTDGQTPDNTTKNTGAAEGVVAQIHDRLDANPQLNNTLTELQTVNQQLDTLRASRDPADQQELARLELKKTDLTAQYNKQSEAPIPANKTAESQIKQGPEKAFGKKAVEDLRNALLPLADKKTAEIMAKELGLNLLPGTDPRDAVIEAIYDKKPGEQKDEKNEDPKSKQDKQTEQMKKIDDYLSQMKDINPDFDAETFRKNLLENPDQWKTVDDALNVGDKVKTATEEITEKMASENPDLFKKHGINPKDIATWAAVGSLKVFSDAIEKAIAERTKNPNLTKEDEEKNKKDGLLVAFLKALGLIIASGVAAAASTAVKEISKK